MLVLVLVLALALATFELRAAVAALGASATSIPKSTKAHGDADAMARIPTSSTTPRGGQISHIIGTFII
jgi:hypothetical protein